MGTKQSTTTSSIDKYSDSTLSSSLFESSSVGQNASEAISDSQANSSNTKEDSVEKPFYVSISDDNYLLLKDLNGNEIDNINYIYQKKL